jgi:hypothetical protein
MCPQTAAWQTFNFFLIVTMCPRTATQLNRLEAVCATCGVEKPVKIPGNRPPTRPIVAVRANCGTEFVGASRHRTSSSFLPIPREIIEYSSATRRFAQCTAEQCLTMPVAINHHPCVRLRMPFKLTQEALDASEEHQRTAKVNIFDNVKQSLGSSQHLNQLLVPPVCFR